MRDRAEEAGALAKAVARQSYGKLVAFLAARTGDLAQAEDALSDAFAAALAEWPKRGCPKSPEAWLLTVARRKMIDRVRGLHRQAAAMPTLELLSEETGDAGPASDVPDRRLALLFAAAHPAIRHQIRAPLMLQTVLGLSAEAIGSAFLVAPATMSKRLVRAKEKIRAAGIPFAVPERDELEPRLAAVLEAIYTAFSEGWIDAAGTDPARRDLAAEAIFLARLVCALLPGEPEATGLLSLMLHAQARQAARRDASGAFVPLALQDPALWDEAMIGEAEALLRQSRTAGRIGRYQIEAALQSAHVERRRTGVADWPAMLVLHDALLALTGSAVAALNRTLVVAEIDGADAARAELNALRDADPRLARYQPYWAVQAELAARTGDTAAAHQACERAIGLEKDPAVRAFLRRRQRLFPRSS